MIQAGRSARAMIIGVFIGGLGVAIASGIARAVAEPAVSVTVDTGQVGSLGTGSVGVGGVFVAPLRGRIVIWSRDPGSRWESTQDVEPGQAVFAGDAWFRVRAIEPAEGGRRGRVTFDRLPSAPGLEVPSGAVILAEGGRLRLDGPAIETATDLRVTAWEPDARLPHSAQVETWPALYARADASPATVGQLRLAGGGHALVGHTTLSVLSLEGASTEHPAWVVLRITTHD